MAHPNFFARPITESTFIVLHQDDGEQVRKIETASHIYPVGSPVSCAYEHPQGIVLHQNDIERLGLQVEA